MKFFKLNSVITFIISIFIILIIMYNIESFQSDNLMFNIKDLSSKGGDGLLGPQGPRGFPGSNAVFPKGVIVNWYGLSNSIPKGWAICNGSGGTPDLRNRFIVGAGGKYTVNRKGGEESVKLTSFQLPSHSHRYMDSSFSKLGAILKSRRWGKITTRDNKAFQLAKNTNKSGANQPHNNMPPFYALFYIMKL